MKLPHWLRGSRRRDRFQAVSTSARRHYRNLGFESLEGRRLLTSIVVTTASDAASHSGVSLRDAIITANTDAANAISDTITFDASLNGSTITLSQGQLEIGAGTVVPSVGVVTINGGNQITISGNNTTGVLSVIGGNAVLNGLAIIDASQGGGLFNEEPGDGGTLLLTNSTISGSVNGGGIENYGIMTVINSTISGNYSANSGGGIYNAGTMTVSDSTISGNTGNDGGGIENSATMTVVNSTISGNSTSNTGDYGGGIENSGSAFSHGTMTLSNSTVSGNTAGNGGGVNDGGVMVISNSTIAANSALDNGDGIYDEAFSSGTSLTLLSTIVAGNMPVNSNPSASDYYGAALAAGSTNNLIGIDSGSLGSGLANGVAGNQVGSSAHPIIPLLGPLANNGGSTETMALEANSPAINAGGPITTLASSINATATSLASGAFTNFAAIASTSGTYVIQIDNEEIEITSYSSGTVTVVRGYNGTTAAAHAAGATVILPFDQIGDARVGAPDIGAYEYTVSPPAIGNFGGTVTYTVGNGPTIVASGATVSAGSNGVASSKLTVSVGSAGGADAVTIAAGGGVTTSGSQVLYNGTLIGNFVAGSGASPLLVQFNGAATQTSVQAVIEHVAFYNTNGSASVYDRTIGFTLTDSKNVASTPVTKTVHFVASPPAIGNISGTVTYTAGSGATLLASGATVTAGSNGLADAKLTVSVGSSGGADVVTVVAGSGVTISGSTLSYNGTAVANFTAGAGASPLLVQFFASATAPAVQAVVDQVAFYNTNSTPSIYDRTASFTLTDSKGTASTPATETIHFVASPPVIGNLGATVNYTPGSSATVVASGATVTAGSNGLAAAKLTVGLGSAGSADVLTIVAGGGITLNGSQVLYNGTVIGNFGSGAGSSPLVVQFNSAATAAAVQAVVDDVAYYNTNPSMSVYDRTVSFSLTDGKGVSSSAASKTIHVL
ncbi:MAG TPA: choice-of-anchor Q domain-containing protein [Pirellulales bacterium]|jgi:hypothetical protein|nr:choice-of-anchor Q domain-containing protein [Pirellulales bacterium]